MVALGIPARTWQTSCRAVESGSLELVWSMVSACIVDAATVIRHSRNYIYCNAGPRNELESTDTVGTQTRYLENEYCSAWKVKYTHPLGSEFHDGHAGKGTEASLSHEKCAMTQISDDRLKSTISQFAT